jgi:hypothetical protein
MTSSFRSSSRRGPTTRCGTLDAALIHLEPLSEAAARDFIGSGRAAPDPKVSLIAERADVVENPLYMQVARELHGAGLLQDVDTRLVTRLALRVRLLDAWWNGLKERRLHATVAVAPEDREKALEGLQMLACAGLAADAQAAGETNGRRRALAARVATRARKEVEDAPRRRVESWKGAPPHPFVDQAAKLCEKALGERQPGKYIWIDETGVVSKLGPRASEDKAIADSRQWISPAAGWLALDSLAQQLVADIVVILNLSLRGDPAEREERLRHTSIRGKLPPCFTEPGGRDHMRASGDGDTVVTPRPGSTCRAGCPARLCRTRRPASRCSGGGLGEAFCRNQRMLLGRTARPAPWQQASRQELQAFWTHMERRARSET